jgi:hypothetical protein
MRERIIKGPPAWRPIGIKIRTNRASSGRMVVPTTFNLKGCPDVMYNDSGTEQDFANLAH